MFTFFDIFEDLLFAGSCHSSLTSLLGGLQSSSSDSLLLVLVRLDKTDDFSITGGVEDSFWELVTEAIISLVCSSNDEEEDFS